MLELQKKDRREEAEYLLKKSILIYSLHPSLLLMLCLLHIFERNFAKTALARDLFFFRESLKLKFLSVDEYSAQKKNLDFPFNQFDLVV